MSPCATKKTIQIFKDEKRSRKRRRRWQKCELRKTKGFESFWRSGQMLVLTFCKQKHVIPAAVFMFHRGSCMLCPPSPRLSGDFSCCESVWPVNLLLRCRHFMKFVSKNDLGNTIHPLHTTSSLLCFICWKTKTLQLNMWCEKCFIFSEWVLNQLSFFHKHQQN